jgi:hypothetical protein
VAEKIQRELNVRTNSEQIRGSVDWRLRQIRLAMEIGAIKALKFHLAANCLLPDQIYGNGLAHETIAEAKIWLEDAMVFEAAHGAGSKLNHNHPFVIKLANLKKWIDSAKSRNNSSRV